MSGELGNILWMRGRYGKEVDENYLKNWRVDPDKAGAGILLDQGPICLFDDICGRRVRYCSLIDIKFILENSWN